MAKLKLELSYDDIIDYAMSRLEGLQQFTGEPEIKYNKKYKRITIEWVE